MASVIDVSRDQLLERRTAILSRIALSEREFAEASKTRSLSSEEWEAKEELEEIEFLLGSTR